MEKARWGEEVIMVRDGVPVAQLIPGPSQKRRPIFGAFRGQIARSEDFNDPLVAKYGTKCLW